MKALTSDPNALRAALSPPTPRTGATASDLTPQLRGLASLYIVAPPQIDAVPFRSRTGGHTSRSRTRATANAAPFNWWYGLAAAGSNWKP